MRASLTAPTAEQQARNNYHLRLMYIARKIKKHS